MATPTQSIIDEALAAPRGHRLKTLAALAFDGTLIAEMQISPSGLKEGAGSVRSLFSGHTEPLIGYDFAALEPIMVYPKQVRTHRKKRINKKWLKRYGTMPVLKDSLWPTITQRYSPPDAEFTREYLGQWGKWDPEFTKTWRDRGEAVSHAPKENYNLLNLLDMERPLSGRLGGVISGE